ncbi:copper resistance protein CopC [Solirubrobacter sp. CPCC 204708]|uniref:Copper resistance protein CopC n=1 Tax=Solirubrobacter deserti TaxID=2282478 RepID=A0ABT4RVD8_9ACTN|nr:copper resistance CopC family protein [Solirubrobacter deserti]MBE2318923.1 copper resistance protein CopC [Solirubrobacter deserti]MDA0142501.1 copper resistance protein CopC [Solirubrobacter deserti]
MRKKVTTALAATAAVSAIATATAFAHTEVKSTYPGKNKTASTRIGTVSVTFTGQIRSGTITVTGPGGTVSSGKGGRDPRDVRKLRVPLKSSKRAGTYTAKWTMKAADGHTQTGSFKFKLK